jgi:hypothetical protein
MKGIRPCRWRAVNLEGGWTAVSSDVDATPSLVANSSTVSPVSFCYASRIGATPSEIEHAVMRRA